MAQDWLEKTFVAAAAKVKRWPPSEPSDAGGFLVPEAFARDVVTELEWVALEAGATTRERRFWRRARREVERRFARRASP